MRPLLIALLLAGAVPASAADASAPDAGGAVIADAAVDVAPAPPPGAVPAVPAAVVPVAAPSLLLQPEPAAPRALWLWAVITGVVVGSMTAVLLLMSRDPTQPDCPTGYRCPR